MSNLLRRPGGQPANPNHPPGPPQFGPPPPAFVVGAPQPPPPGQGPGQQALMYIQVEARASVWNTVPQPRIIQPSPGFLPPPSGSLVDFGHLDYLAQRTITRELHSLRSGSVHDRFECEFYPLYNSILSFIFPLYLGYLIGPQVRDCYRGIPDWGVSIITGQRRARFAVVEIKRWSWWTRSGRASIRAQVVRYMKALGQETHFDTIWGFMGIGEMWSIIKYDVVNRWTIHTPWTDNVGDGTSIEDLQDWSQEVQNILRRQL